MKPTKPLAVRLLALTLALATALSAVPAPAFAEAADELAAAPQAEAAASEVPAEKGQHDEAAAEPSADDAAEAPAKQAPKTDAKPSDAPAPKKDEAPSSEQPGKDSSSVAGAAKPTDKADVAEPATGDPASAPAVDVVEIRSANGSKLDAAKAGDVLAAKALSAGTELTDAQLSSATFQWYEGDSEVKQVADAHAGAEYAGYKAIDGATKRSFAPATAQSGKNLAVKVTLNGVSTWAKKSVPVVSAEGQTTADSPDAEKDSSYKQGDKADQSADTAATDAANKAAAQSEDKQVSVSFQLIGPDANGASSFWASKSYEVVENTTADVVIERALNEAGLVHTSSTTQYGYYLQDITSPDGRVLGWDAATGRYWQLFVDGASSDVGASSVALHEGTKIVLSYSGYGETLTKTSVSFVGPDGNGGESTWASCPDLDLASGMTAADATLSALDAAGVTNKHSMSAYGLYLEEITSPIDGKSYGYDAQTGKYWQLFVNGKAAETGASFITLNPGDRVQWIYSGYGEEPQETSTVEVIGADSLGRPEVWVAEAPFTVDRGTTADAVIEQALKAAGLVHTSSTTQYGYYLEDITSLDGRKLGYDAQTGKYWQLFVDGKASDVGASSVNLREGTKIVLCYSAFGETLDNLDAKQVATLRVIGSSENGGAETWLSTTEFRFTPGQTAADLIEQGLKAANLVHTSSTTQYGYYLEDITSLDGRKLGYDAQTGKYWQLFVDGAASDVGASSVALKPGTSVELYYSAYGASLPKNVVPVVPDAPRPSYDSTWPGFAKGLAGAVTPAPTPTVGGAVAWEADLGNTLNKHEYASDPIIVNGDVYIAVQDELRIIDSATGKLKKKAKLATSIDSVSRMIYYKGTIVVPLAGGQLQALTADELTTVWLTEPIVMKGKQTQQSLSSLTVVGDYVCFATDNGSSTSGVLTCVNLQNGAVLWSKPSDDAGYYWAGAAKVGATRIAVGDCAGKLTVRDAANDGAEVSSLSLGSAIKTTVVADGDDLFAVTVDGTLHKVHVASDRSLSEVRSVKFSDYSTCTPTISNGKLYVGGSQSGKGVLAIVDLKDFSVQKVGDFANGEAIPAEIKSTPLVSQQGDKTYVYFTANHKSGASYLYCSGEEHARVLYAPEEGKREYTLSSIVADADGSLYYIDDAGYLFKIKPGAANPDPKPEPVDSGGHGSGEDTGKNPPSDSGKKLGANIQLSGNGNGAGNGKKNALAIALRSKVSAEGDQNGEAASLLAGFESAEATGVTSTTLAADDGARDAGFSGSAEAASSLPIWPFVGMGVGAAVLIAAVATKRRKEGDE